MTDQLTERRFVLHEHITDNRPDGYDGSVVLKHLTVCLLAIEFHLRIVCRKCWHIQFRGAFVATESFHVAEGDCPMLMFRKEISTNDLMIVLVGSLCPFRNALIGFAMGKMIMGTVAGDLHDIGKNLVIMMIESAGFEVIDLGVDVPHERFVEAVRANPDVKIVGLSALLTTTMPALRDAVALLNQQDFRKDIKIMVGGAPITQAFADEIGADAYTEDAASAAIKAKELVS